MNVTEELRKRRREYRRTALGEAHHIQPGKRARRIMAKAAARKPMTGDAIVQSLILNERRKAGPTWARQFIEPLAKALTAAVIAANARARA